MHLNKNEEFNDLIKLYDLTYTTLGRYSDDDMLRRRLYTILNTVFDLIADLGYEDDYVKWNALNAADVSHMYKD